MFKADGFPKMNPVTVTCLNLVGGYAVLMEKTLVISCCEAANTTGLHSACFDIFR